MTSTSIETVIWPSTQVFQLAIWAIQCVHGLVQEFDIDTERLPLGQLSKEQVQRGYDVLERLRAAITGGGESLEKLSSEFYQVSVHHCVFHTNLLLSPPLHADSNP